MGMKPKVLIYVPLAPRTPKIWGRTLQSLFNLRWDAPCELVFGRADIPKDGKMPSMEEKYQNIADKYNQGRDIALNGDYDAMLTVESDMIIPPLALERLTRIETDVAYGLYVSRHGHHNWLCATELTEKYALFISEDLEYCNEVFGSVVESEGVGMGCTLIWRHVLERVPFRYDARGKGNWRGQDYFFALDLDKALFEQKHDLGVVCGHINTDNKRIYWPSPTFTGGYSVEYLDPSQLRALRPGEKVELELSRFGSEEILMVQQ